MTENRILETGESASASVDGQANGRLRILLVEDEPDLLRLNAEVLTDSGYLVQEAEDGEVAWQALNLGAYDLLVTDNDMPKMTGVELIEKVHAARMLLPVIMVSGTMPAEEHQPRSWPQLHARLQKPYTILEFLAKVKEALRASARNCHEIANGHVAGPDGHQ